ncbi:MAG: PQQ-dependent sugar dehydrogenase [Myxococcota bacterium]
MGGNWATRVFGATVVVLVAAACGGGVRGSPFDDDDGGDRDAGDQDGDTDQLPGDGDASPVGLTRFLNTSCSLSASAASTVFDGLASSSLTGLVPVPGVPFRMALAMQSGLIVDFNRETYTGGSEHTALDLVAEVYDNGGGEKGLYSIAFAPDFGASGGYLYASYAIDNPGQANDRDTRIERYTCTVAAGVLTCDEDSAYLIIEIPRPDGANNHNGGQIFFGGGGLLFITTGDSASGGDPDNWGQNLTLLGGKLLRIDPTQTSGAGNYSVPADNPFVGQAGARAEIYAYGFRNPWRASYDATSGRIFVADVGQETWEEIDIIQPGGNYGWDLREGAHDYSGGCPSGCIDPIHEYESNGGRLAITGGFVYRGTDIPNLLGAYVFADYGTGEVFRIDEAVGGGAWTGTKIMDTGMLISSFGYDEEGEIYVLGFSGGIMRLVVDDGIETAPPTLTATGCYASVEDRQLIAAAVPYDLRVPFWSDGAGKRRYFILPGTSTVTGSVSGAWEFPVGTILVKEFDLQEEAGDPTSIVPIETRFLVQVAQDTWQGYSYIWNAAGTEATLRPDSEFIGDYTLEGAAHEHVFPSRGACNTCHTPNGGYVLGIRTENLNRSRDYGAGQINQIEAFATAGFLAAPLTGVLPQLTPLEDSGASLGARARSWLASNCSNCHSGTANGGRFPDMRFATTLDASRLCEIINQAQPPIIPGQGATSPIVEDRAGFRGSGQMPPLATRVPDTDAVGVLRQWIDAMDDVPPTLTPEYICPP